MNRLSSLSSISALLDFRAEQSPEKMAYLYVDRAAPPVACSYSDLRSRAHQVAAHLMEAGHCGDRVLLLFPPGLDFLYGFLGCAAAGVIAVPASPPNPLKPARSLARLQSIAESARPTIALTTRDMLNAIRSAVSENPVFARMKWIATDELPPIDYSITSPRGVASPQAIALLQYTSGSTADPKGVALSHANVLHNVSYFDQGWDHSADSVQVNWLPAFHDLGLLYGVLTPLWGGFLGIQMSPIDVIQKPYIWLKTLSAYRASHSAGPNFIYDLCQRKVSDEEITTLDLSHWKMALTAAEPIRAETLTRFAARFSSTGFSMKTFSPGYGLAEGTCKVVAVACSEEPVILHLKDDRLEQNVVEIVAPGPGTRAVVGCGRPAAGVRLAIVDPDKRTARAAGRIGEIWIAGPSVACGYWNQPQATSELLAARLAMGDETPYLRTGDLGFIHDGQLYITGRIKDVIIVRGSNHYPQDLEYTAQDACPSIRPGCCAAFSYQDEGEERIAIVAEVDQRTAAWSTDEIVASITQAIAEAHGLRVQWVELVKPGTIPKTTSGKIQRGACRTAMLTGAMERVA